MTAGYQKRGSVIASTGGTITDEPAVGTQSSRSAEIRPVTRHAVGSETVSRSRYRAIVVSGTGDAPASSSRLSHRDAADLLDQAQDICDSLVDSVRLVDVNEQLFSLRNVLLDYLDLAGPADRGPQKLVLLILQTMLTIKEEHLTFDQKRALREAVIRLDSPQVTEDHIKIARQTLLKSGLDPTAAVVCLPGDLS